MTDPVVGPQTHALAQLQVNGQSDDEKAGLPLPSSMIIESIFSLYPVTEQRKKKEVISIEDSEEEPSRPVKPLRPKERKPIPDPRKPRKQLHRCLLCK